MTTFTANRALKGFPVAGVGHGGSLKYAYGELDIAVNPVADDIYEMLRLPAGAVIVGGYFRGDRLDTNATEELDLDVGWAANGGSGTYDALDADGLLNTGVMTGDAFTTGSVANVAAVGYNYPLNGKLLEGVFPEFTKETVVQLTCIAAAATFVAGTLSVLVFYTTADG
jgi:hypothetical protein